MLALYRKYRPQSFADLIGQNHIKVTLQNEIEREEVGHAYLFCGPRGLGKTTTARLFAKAINCQNLKKGQSEPCNQCPACLSLISNSNIDVMEIDAASHTGVDNVRENIIENARFTPNANKYKIFIIDEVHMLSISAFNALLKTLEEPPAHAVFILCTTEAHKLPATIISRCQRFDFKKVSSQEMLKRLNYLVSQEKKEVAEAVLKNIVLHSEGCIRDAESLLGKILTLGDKVTSEQAEVVLPTSDFRQLIEFLEFLLEKNNTAAIELVNQLVADGVDLEVFTASLLEFLRKILLIKAGGNLKDFGLELDEGSEKAAEKLAERFNYQQLLKTIEIFILKNKEIKTAILPQFPLELAVVELTEEAPANQGKGDDFNLPMGGGSDLAPRQKVKPQAGKIAAEFIPQTEKAESVVRVDLLSGEDKLKPKNFFDFKKVKDNWLTISDKLLEKNYTLAALLKISQPERARGEILEIAVKSKFYQERLMEIKNKKIVEEAISEVIKAEVIIDSVVKEKIEPLAEKTEEVKVEPVKKMEKPANAAEEVIGMF